MKHYGDITKINGAEVEPVWIITGGSPCQDLSVAGKRAGLAGQRSGLYMEQIRIVKEMRDESKKRYADSGSDVDIRHISPRYMVWENVPGAFSSNKGEDFRAVLEEAAKVIERNAVIPGPPNGKWPSAGLILFDHGSIAWRQHDAQFWGVPQRRKRICMLCDFNGQTAGEILFECWRETKDTDSVETVTDLGAKSESEVQPIAEGLSGDTEQSGTQGESAAGSFEGCPGETGACLNGWDVQSKHIQPEHGIAEALYAGECRGGGGESYVMQDAAYTLKIRGKKDVDRYGKRAGKGPLVQTELSGTLGVSQDQTLICLNDQGGQQMDVSEEVSGTLRAQEHGHQPLVYSVDQGAGKSSCQIDVETAPTLATTHDGAPAVVYGISSNDSNAMKSSNPHSGIYEAETARTLDLNGGSPACNQGGMAVVQGADMYNGALTGDVAATMSASGGNSASHSGPTVICMEGNGQRDSHKGDGYKESETMYTLNTVEQHAVAYRKQAHPQNAEEGQGWEETEKHDTFNAFDNTESRVPTVVVDKKISGFDNYNIALTGDVAKTLQGEGGGSGVNEGCVVETNKKTVYDWHRQDTRMTELPDVCVTAAAGWGGGGNNMPYVLEQGAVQGQAWDGSQVSPTLTANNANGAQRMPDKDNFNAVVQSIETFHCTTEEDKVQTLKARDYKDPQVVSYGLDRAAYNQGKNAKFDFSIEQEKIGAETSRGPGAVCETYQNVTGTMCASISKGTSNQLATDDMFVANVSVVRRLTPLECTRLQNFPDGWVDIGDWVDTKGKLHKDSDSNKYKALGNSIALPFWIWLAERICNQLRKDGDDQISMASLFDGIGGFPLSFSKFGAKPIWASEIEEYPIAVTKKRFPEA